MGSKKNKIVLCPSKDEDEDEFDDILYELESYELDLLDEQFEQDFAI